LALKLLLTVKTLTVGFGHQDFRPTKNCSEVRQKTLDFSLVFLIFFTKKGVLSVSCINLLQAIVSK